MSKDFPDADQRLAVCFAQWRTSRQRGAEMPWNHLMGVWGIDPEYLAPFRLRIEAYLHGAWQSSPADIDARMTADDLIQSVGDGLAVVPLHGPIMKHQTLLGELSGMTSIRMVQQAVAQAVQSDDIRAVMLHVESPGGHVAGMHEFAEFVRRAKQQKPIVAHIEDLGASAAYWAIAYATRITANAPAEVGSLRTMAIVVDSSRKAAQRGETVRVISRAQFKGVGVEGTELTPEHLTYIQDRVDAQDGFFLHAVAQGRQLDPAALERVTDGRVWLASEAKSLGLVDDVRSFDQAVQDLRRMISPGPGGAVRQRISQRRASIAAFKEIDDAPRNGR